MISVLIIFFFHAEQIQTEKVLIHGCISTLHDNGGLTCALQNLHSKIAPADNHLEIMST